MSKGLLIMLIVFVVIALLHIISLKMMRLNEKKKRKFRKVFWYFYGIIFLLQGLAIIIEKERFVLVSVVMSILGLVTIILNYLDKINPKVNQK